MIVIDDLYKSYCMVDGWFSVVLKGLLLQVFECFIIVVVGLSGVGKLILVCCISLLE